jgi:hypothetical protein
MEKKMLEEYFAHVQIPEEIYSKRPGLAEQIGYVLDSKPFLEEDMWAFSNYDSLKLSPVEFESKGKKFRFFSYSMTMSGYRYRLHASIGQSSIGEYIEKHPTEHMKELEVKARTDIQGTFGKEIDCFITRVTATDVPASFKIIQKRSPGYRPLSFR